MAYDENIRIIAEELERLKNNLHNLDVEIPPHASTDAGKILAVDSDGDLEWKNEYSYTPPAYSNTVEINTSQKWIDGKDIYMKTFSDNMGTGESNITIDTELSTDKIVGISGILKYGDRSYPVGTYVNSNTRFTVSYDQSNDNLIISGATSFAESDFFITVYYTKPDPIPEQETKSKKKGAK